MAKLVPAAGRLAEQAVRAVPHALPAAGAAAQRPPPGVIRGSGQTGPWPLQSSIEFCAVPGAVPRARQHVTHVLPAWGLAALGDDASLVTSELVTNAVAAARTAERRAPVVLRLQADKAGVLILVWDASLRSPVRMDADGNAEAGRGLLLVEAISERWDWYFPKGTGGKVVWALLEMT